MAFGASISGSVYDPSSAVVPQAQVALINTATRAELKTRTSASGQYEFLSLTPGTYELLVQVPGFRMGVRGPLKLESDTARKESFLLEVGKISEALTVTAAGTPRPQYDSPRRIRVGGNLQATRLLRQPRPAYPEKARSEGREGTVNLTAVILKDGTIGGLTPMPDSDPELAEAAMDAVRQWQYSPTLLNGEPVEVVTSISVNFRLAP
jgi:TonB family protein